MGTYMTQFSYTGEAVAALAKNPEDRRAPVAALMESLGGRLIAMYYSFGDYDGLVIFETPDDTTAVTGVVAAALGGHIKETKTTVLFTTEQAIEAMGKAGSIVFKAPQG